MMAAEEKFHLYILVGMISYLESLRFDLAKLTSKHANLPES